MTDALRHVLVTGTARAEGRAVAEALARDARVGSVLCLDDVRHTASLGAVPGLEGVVADLTRERELRDLLLGERARRLDVVVHVPPDAVRAGRSGDPSPIVRSTEILLHLSEEHPRIARFVLASSMHVYRVSSHEPTLIDENHPLELSAHAPASVRDLVHADLIACARMGVSRLQIAVLRCAEVLGPHASGQLQDYLSSRVCLRPLGFDPMLNVLALRDFAHAARLAALSSERGVFNIAGGDSLPLSELTQRAGRLGIALPGPALAPLYRLRALATAFRFSYAPSRNAFHYGAIPDGRRAERALGYAPAVHDAFRDRSRDG
jgi:UDP-glucose 4-epimerase